MEKVNKFFDRLKIKFLLVTQVAEAMVLELGYKKNIYIFTM